MNDIQALRTHLFSTLTALQDKNNPMDIERAKAVCQVGSVIIDSAKAEIDFARVNGSVDTLFFHKPAQIGYAAENSKPASNAVEMKDHVPKIFDKSPIAAVQKIATGNVTIKDNVLTHKMRG